MVARRRRPRARSPPCTASFASRSETLDRRQSSRQARGRRASAPHPAAAAGARPRRDRPASGGLPAALRTLLATALYSGLRISELLGLVWDDVDLGAGAIHVRAQLSRTHRGVPARRVPPKTPSAIRIPLVPQLAELPRQHRRGSAFNARSDWVFATGRGTPLGHRNVERRALRRAARIAGSTAGRNRRFASTTAPHLRQPPNPRPPPRPCPGQPHPRPRPRDDHARRVHPPL
jgi:integrase